MAIDYSVYVKTKEFCIKKHKRDKRLFLFDFRVNGKRYRKIFKLITVDDKPRVNLVEARLKLEELKEKLRNNNEHIKITLNQLFYNYMKYKSKTDWNQKKIDNFDLYIGESGIEHTKPVSTRNYSKTRKLYRPTKIGHKYIVDIKPMHIEKIMSVMERNNLSPRTQKGIIEILNPLFKDAIKNKYLVENPTEFITVKIPSQKRIVTNATELFKKVHNGIEELYKEDPFYRTFFLFGLTGRRKSEILNLKWKNIDTNANYYWIEDTKNGDSQRYPLPKLLKSSLLEMKRTKKEFVFTNPVTNIPLKNPDRQMKNLRKFTGISNLTMHYMRNILVSALAENSIEAITLSGILGHKQVGTINKYLSQNTMKSGLKGLGVINKILNT